MDKDVESRMNRLCNRYAEAAGHVNILRPNKLPSRRGQMRLQNRVVDVLGQLVESRKTPAAALVRLAYVRAMRASQPNARLGPEEKKEVESFEKELDRRLGANESNVLFEFRSYLRKLLLIQQGSHLTLLTGSSTPWPLEYHARACIRSIVDDASAAGALAGTKSPSYAGGSDAE